jgi:hypothetical protein
MNNAPFLLLWLLAAWAFGFWGVDKLRISQILRILCWSDRIEWLKGHRPSAVLYLGLKLFQIGFVIWQGQFISRALPWSRWFVIGQVLMAVLVILFGVRRSMPKMAAINAGGLCIRGRFVTAWPERDYYRGIILYHGQQRMGTISVDGMNTINADETVQVGLFPHLVCFVTWITTCLCLGICLLMMIL